MAGKQIYHHKSDGWKITAIIFIVLFVLETIIFVWILSWGLQIVAKENECSVNVCSGEEIVSYYYDESQSICYCYDVNEEIVKQQFIR